MVTASNGKYFGADPGNRPPPDNVWSRDAGSYASLVVKAALRAFDPKQRVSATPGLQPRTSQAFPTAPAPMGRGRGLAPALMYSLFTISMTAAADGSVASFCQYRSWQSFRSWFRRDRDDVDSRSKARSLQAISATYSPPVWRMIPETVVINGVTSAASSARHWVRSAKSASSRASTRSILD